VVEWWTWPLVVAAVGGLIAGIWAFANRKGSERFQARSLNPPTWPEMWQHMKDQDARINALEEKFNSRTRAISNILRALALQWPKNVPAPIFDKTDLDILGDTIPHQWAKNASSPSTGSTETKK
jgi:hypothetical protein